MSVERAERYGGEGGVASPRDVPEGTIEALGESVPRFAHGSRVPGWDDAVDLEKDPSEVPDPATTPVPDELRAQVEAAMARYPDRHSASLPALRAAQDRYGWCSPEAIDQVACVMRVTPGELAAVATFYDMLETEPGARHAVYVCTNISCSMLGADRISDALHDAVDDPAFVRVRHFECLGACDIAPMASVDGTYVGPLAPEDCPRIVEDLRAGRAVLEAKQLRFRACRDPAGRVEGEAPPPAEESP
jgi:NADH:ubiquinone oxidoreductase subunit E